MLHNLTRLIEAGRAELKRLFQRHDPEPPEDPYAYVGAPKKPRPPSRSAAVAEPLD
jgi:hypothetical protein